RSPELGRALAAGSTILNEPDAPRKWIQQAARVRPALARWRRMRLYADALGATPAALEVVQLPADGSRWVGWLLDPNAQPRSGRLSLVMDRAARPGADDAWAGLFLDQWTETIPANRASTGIAFHYDNPGAEAAQMLLLAVPPTNAPIWDLDSLISI